MINCEIAMRAAETLLESIQKGAQPSEVQLKRCLSLLEVGLEEVTRPHIVWGRRTIRIIRDQWPEERCAEALDYVRHELVERSAEAGEDILEELLERYEKLHPATDQQPS
ncbi:hypothetical protein [Geomonas sp.]|uniref:hypothetical protein n=1 Tax=Geomonas sp. TaxID=2651584 RepID=UPI002B46E746|nr:hypothetical protein [Geomonas sp.]HJV37063.1 hypothetical protein [Geomonas sp.]